MMNGHSVTSAGAITTVDAGWHIARTGDFTGDGKTDILWRNDDGRVGIWEMSGHAIAWAGAISTADGSWQAAAHHEWV